MRILYAGLDVGGTHTRIAYRFDVDTASTTIEGAGVNAQRDGIDETVRVLAALLRKLPLQAADRLVVYAGVAGAGTAELQRTLEGRLHENLSHPQSMIRVVSDAEIAFGAAFRDGPGVLIIAGTGSIVWARDAAGRMHRSGGHGYLLGDEGGGYRIGLAGLKAVLDAADGGPATALSKAVCQAAGLCSAEDILQYVYRKEPVQQLAPIVLETAEKGDPVAIRIVRHQALALAARFQWIIRRSGLSETRIALAGGLTQHAYYRSILVETLGTLQPGSECIDVITPPAEAALSLATETAPA